MKSTQLQEEKSLFVQQIAGLHLVLAMCTVFALTERFEFSQGSLNICSIIFLALIFQLGALISCFLVKAHQNSPLFSHCYNLTMAVLGVGFLVKMRLLEAITHDKVVQFAAWAGSFLVGTGKAESHVHAECDCECQNERLSCGRFYDTQEAKLIWSGINSFSFYAGAFAG